ncbi:hypothetical protein AVEN_243203-1 [Araneus ventricosus]|uniref:Uncharacterized protein n=1 Tax=Araneus ventricosus TaxID=182803 RepID=A0A4Y2F0W3_ARAVE|nr:hypothetical protein AVEN_243203-1 [Araneus ventricosus]
MREPSISAGKAGRFEDVESRDDDTSESRNNLSTNDFESDEIQKKLPKKKDLSESSNNDREIDVNFRWEDCNVFQPEIYNFGDTNSGVS